MEKNSSLLMRAKHILYFLFVLTCLAFFQAFPDPGFAAEQSQTEAFIDRVASFKNAENAEKYSKLLESNGMKTWTKKMNVPGKGEYHRVYVGFFENRKSAVKAMRQAKEARNGLEIRVPDDCDPHYCYTSELRL